MLSSRVIVLTFLERRSAHTLAGAVFRRPLRLLLPILFSLALPSIVGAAGGFKNAQRLSEITANSAAIPPAVFPNFLEYFNSIFTLFFDTQPYKSDRGIAYTPLSGLSWVIPVIFSQSFTVYVFAALLPFISLRAKVWGFPGFIIVTYWLGSWAWYNLTALQLAEFTLVYLPLAQSKRKLYIPPAILLVLGLALKWAWASNPAHRNDEYIYHTDKSYGGLNRYLNANLQPYPRVDDFFVVAGSMALLDLNAVAQRIFANPVFRYLGRISFMLFLTSGTVCLALGSKLTVVLRDQRGMTSESSILAALFFACIPLSLVVAEICYWLVEWPSFVAARWLFRWIRV
ncbi:hypothetical protein BDZ90DRAFT_233499 [Jaminaea rosea]|uniref:Uncharacterized protein n=1 Tax=Jaminaea rosea TaxID=1569628 RepID=A0A316UM76_9BASI|nr:hypothetical protein BDZ90DRAFT_233499 [Jaminaea rosea]PWN26367.1 hypothetical protein BDZ90DRAFT_233499 [Jaminaea rosea]